MAPGDKKWPYQGWLFGKSFQNGANPIVFEFKGSYGVQLGNAVVQSCDLLAFDVACHNSLKKRKNRLRLCNKHIKTKKIDFVTNIGSSVARGQNDSLAVLAPAVRS